MSDTLKPTYFTCPDGDVHEKLIVRNIWIDEIDKADYLDGTFTGFLRFLASFSASDNYRVVVDLYDSDLSNEDVEWTWERRTKDEAIEVRNHLMRELVEDHADL